MKRKQVKLAELVEDLHFYPRGQVSDVHVRTLKNAIEAGEKLPEMVVDEDQLRIADGIHRNRAYKDIFGPDHKLWVQTRKYADDAEFYADAVALNSGHGRTLSPWEKARIAMRMKELGLEVDKIAECLRVTGDKVAEMLDSGAVAGGMPVALKNTLRHLRHQKLTKKQEEANRRASGMNQLFYFNQLISLIEGDAIDEENPRLPLTARQLYALLGDLIERLPEPEEIAEAS